MTSRFVDEDMDWLSLVDEPKEKDWDEGKHPREPAGAPGGGRFAGGGGGEGEGETEGGGKSGKTGKSGEKKIKEISDFAKADIGMYYNPHDKAEAEAFIDLWNQKIDRTAGEFKTQFLGNGAVKANMTVEYDPHDNAMTVDANWRGDDDSGKIKSTFYFDEKRVHMDYYRLPESDQGHGIMKQVMAQQMQIWKDAGIEKVDLYANIDVGGHAWARYGFEPLDHVWENLSSEIESRIDRLGTGDSSGGDGAESWDEMSAATQNRVENAWRSNTFDEFHESEIQSWRDSGQPLEDAKEQLVHDFNTTDAEDIRREAGLSWATNAVESAIKERAEGDSPVPYTTEQIMGSISLLYDSRHGDGSGDFTVNFNDDALGEPKNLDIDPTLPGTPTLEPHEYLTEDMRTEITDALDGAFVTKAEHAADRATAPNYLRDNVGELQDEVWDSMDDSDKFDWAESHRPELVGGSRPRGSGQIPKAEEDVLRKATLSNDPKAIWIIADSKHGKDLLLDRMWDGQMDLNDKLAMERFDAYVGKGKK